ncbi:MAG: hypothetical protein ACI9XU_000576 [Arenicella sp.]|jgi:hypothetical protein
MQLWVLCLLFIGIGLSGPTAAQTWQADGNIKYRLVGTDFPKRSIFSDLVGDNTVDGALTSRLNFNLEFDHWSVDASYQIAGIHGDTIEYAQRHSSAGTQSLDIFTKDSVPDDNTRFIDLTEVVSDGSDYAVVHRLDRLVLGYHGEKNIFKVGRQAVSWGNGLIYTPMDFFNPFDPTAIDTEYKSGDDMLYAQHLFDNGNDFQIVWVARRNEDQHSTREVNSIALKYHGFVGSWEFDLLAADHYSDTIIGFGGAISIGGSVVRGDWVVTDTNEKLFHSFVTNISYAWIALDRNVTGSLEYFHNDFGVRIEKFGRADLADNLALMKRFQRGELFTLGRDYIAGSAVVEMVPLWVIITNIFYNLSDDSALTQLVSQHDLSQNIQFVAALSIPVGPRGTEFGGLEANNFNSESELKYNESSWSIYAQLAWYF